MKPSLLCCPVCGKPLTFLEKTAQCPSGHTYDRAARGGYIHLLRQHRRGSADPGDSAAMCQARTRFLEGGWYEPLRRQVAALVHDLNPDTVLDAGCGEGWYTKAMLEALPHAQFAGIDLSRYALRHAGRTCPRAALAIASLFDLPLAAQSVDLVVHLFAPMCAEEFARILRPGGRLLTVTPGARHLWGMKQILYAQPYENPTEIRTLSGFTFEREICVQDTITLTDAQDIAALYQMTPYAWKTPKQAADRLLNCSSLTTPIDFQIHLYRKS